MVGIKGPTKDYWQRNAKLPAKEAINRWWARRHPEVRWGDFYADYCAREAELGNPGPLIGYLRSGGKRTPAIDRLFVELLERAEGARARDNRKILEQTRIALEIEALIAKGEAKNQKQAIAIVRSKRRRDRSNG